jgi:cytochrome P450
MHFLLLLFFLEQKTKLQASFLWASLANTVPVTVWLVIHLSKRPDLQEEIFRDLGSNSDFSRRDMSEHPLLERCFKEILRLYFDGFLVRAVTDPLGLSMTDRQGKLHQFDCGTTLSAYPMLYHRNAEYFPAPNSFDPKRWEDCTLPMYSFGRIIIIIFVSFFFLSFFKLGGGKSMCSGRLFVAAELKLFVCVLIQNYKFSSTDKVPAMAPEKGGFGVANPLPSEAKEFKIKLEKR